MAAGTDGRVGSLQITLPFVAPVHTGSNILGLFTVVEEEEQTMGSPPVERNRQGLSRGGTE